MRLVSCYIENFGGLSGFSMDFDAGLTTLRAPNGFGKTTLAEFIRVMFYGFPRKTRTGLGKKEKYQPWNGGKYGGHLTFEHEGRRYRIERSFGPRETFALIDLQTGKKSTAFTKNIGQELFGLDAESFERSTYLPQERQTGAMATDSIRAKLAGLVEDDADVGNYQKALEALDKKRKTYAHRVGSGGAVAEDIRQISALQAALTRANGSREELAAVTARIEAAARARDAQNEELAQLRAAIADANEAAARRAYQRHYAALAEAHDAACQERETLLARFPDGTPTAAECADAAAAAEELRGLEGRSVETAADEAARTFTQEHARRFGKAIPADPELEAIRDLCEKRSGIAAELTGCVMADADALEEAERFLAPGIPAAEVLAGHQAALEQAAQLRRQNASLAAAPARQRRSGPAIPAALILGLALAAVGIGLLSGGRFAPGGAALGLGMLALVAAAWLSLRTAVQPGLSPEVRALIGGNEERARALEADVRRFTAAYYPGDPAEALALIRQRAEAYHTLSRADARLRQRREDLKKELTACDEALKAFFLGWGMACHSDPRDLLEQLRRDRDRWTAARAQLADLENRQRARTEAADRLRQRLAGFSGQYGFAPQTRQEAEALQAALWRLEGLEKEIDGLTGQMESYRREHGDSLAAPAAGADPAALAVRERQLLDSLDRVNGALPALELRRGQLRAEAESIGELTDSLARWQEKKEADEKCARLLDETKDFLARARENLATAYMGPIRRSFRELMGRMTGESGERILVTEELEVFLERGGESRALAYFSAGQTDLIRLCMRLALVDALFRQTKPFVILDDPFVNLDDERLADALTLLRELSRDRQIIYLTCHSGRM